jgi:antitoxin FitA
MIQVRNVPDALHRSLKARAAMAGMSLSDYLLGELREIAERPTLAEFRERLHKRKPLPVALDTSGLLREERTSRWSCSMPSATVDWLLQTPAGQRIEERIYARKDTLHTVHLLDVEVAQVLRREDRRSPVHAAPIEVF